jgi:hypothetical protein
MTFCFFLYLVPSGYFETPHAAGNITEDWQKQGSYYYYYYYYDRLIVLYIFLVEIFLLFVFLFFAYDDYK